MSLCAREATSCGLSGSGNVRPGEAPAQDRRVARPDCVSVEPDAARDRLGAFTAVTERQRDRVVGVTGKDEHGYAERPLASAELEELLRRDAERGGGLGAHESGLVPRQLRQGIRQLEEPRIVGEAAVVHGGIGAQRSSSRPAPRGASFAALCEEGFGAPPTKPGRPIAGATARRRSLARALGATPARRRPNGHSRSSRRCSRAVFSPPGKNAARTSLAVLPP